MKLNMNGCSEGSKYLVSFLKGAHTVQPNSGPGKRILIPIRHRSPEGPGPIAVQHDQRRDAVGHVHRALVGDDPVLELDPGMVVGSRGEVEDRLWFRCREDLGEIVRDAGLMECCLRIQVLVESAHQVVDDMYLVSLAEKRVHDVAPDEARAPGDDDVHAIA